MNIALSYITQYGITVITVIILFTSIVFLSTIDDISFNYTNRACNDLGKELNENSHELIHKIIPKNSLDVIDLKFCWVTDRGIQVGKLITVYVEVNSTRYISNNTNFEKITITLPPDVINYWIDPNDKKQKRFEMTNKLTIYNYSENLRSDPINIRFSVPNNISIEYCEYTIKEECFTIHNIIKPAEYHIDEIINTNNSLIRLTYSIIILTILLMFTSYFQILFPKQSLGSIVKMNIKKINNKKEAFIYIIYIINISIVLAFVLFVAEITFSFNIEDLIINYEIIVSLIID